MPLRDLPQEGRDTLPERSGPPSADRLQEPGVAEELAGGVHRLGDAIGVEVQAVSRPQADRPLLVGVVGQADREPLALQDHRIGAGGQMHRAGVAGGDVAELPGRGVQDPVDQRRELLGRRVEGEEPVQAGGDLGGRRDVGPIPVVPVPDQDRGRLRRRREETAQRHRQQGRRDAMAADVQDVEPDLAVAERDDVQAVAGQLVAGPVDPGEVRARDARDLAGQERLLDPRRRLQVAGHPVVGLRQSRVGLLQLDLQAAELQVGLDTRVQFFHLERLGDVIHPADGERLHLVQVLVEGADEDDGDPPEVFIGLQVLAHLIAVHLRHVDVQQDQVRGILPGRQQRQFAARDGSGLVPAILEHAGQDLEVGRDVVHHQDVGRPADGPLLDRGPGHNRMVIATLEVFRMHGRPLLTA